MPPALPGEDELAGILDFDVATAPALSVTVFLNRLKFGTKLDHASNLRAEQEQLEQKGEKSTVTELKDKIKDEFGRLARSYVTHLFKETRSHFNLTTNISQGLGSFDLEIMLKFPLALPTRCYHNLFATFRLRGYFTFDQESQAQVFYRRVTDEIR